MLMCDSHSPVPPLMYSSSNYWNKRKVEYRLGIALILKRSKSKFKFKYFTLKYRKFEERRFNCKF